MSSNGAAYVHLEGANHNNAINAAAGRPAQNKRGCRRRGRLPVLAVLGTLAVCIALLVLFLRQQHHDRREFRRLRWFLEEKFSGLSQSLSAKAADDAQDRYVVDLVPPRKYQYTRGTCWDFGTIAAVEHQYRLQGVQKGWLKPEEYVRFSEQAYGNQIISLCAQPQFRNRCLLPGDRVAFNSTEGGEATLLFSFADQLTSNLVPDSVCPYIQSGDNSSCPDLAKALQSNPIKFTLESFSTLYDVNAIKRALVHKGYVMPISIPVWEVTYYTSCADPKISASDYPECTDPKKCSPCPPDMSTNTPSSGCCVAHSAPFYNMDGEFRKHHAMRLEAGHALALVGFNDEYVTKDGFKGGFIVRNTWMDGVYSFNEFGERKARGSHSIPYFMQQVSEGAEKIMCPNSFNPRNWATCGAAGDYPIASQLANCVDNGTVETAFANLQSLVLVCDAKANPALCKPSPTEVFYNINQTIYGDGLHIACFLKWNNATNEISEICAPPTPIDEIATSFVPQHPLDNDPDYCGYYFLPYALFEESKALFTGAFVNDYQLSFSDSSFAANAGQNSGFDYTYIKASTLTQKAIPEIDNPFPMGPNKLHADADDDAVPPPPSHAPPPPPPPHGPEDGDDHEGGDDDDDEEEDRHHHHGRRPHHRRHGDDDDDDNEGEGERDGPEHEDEPHHRPRPGPHGPHGRPDRDHRGPGPRGGDRHQRNRIRRF